MNNPDFLIDGVDRCSRRHCTAEEEEIKQALGSERAERQGSQINTERALRERQIENQDLHRRFEAR